MKHFLLFLFIIFGLNIQAQTKKNDKLYFSDALAMHLPKYIVKAKKAYRHREFKRAKHLFDTLVETKLKGTYIDNFKFLNLKDKTVALYDFKKPVYLLTYASWCVPGKGEIPALNELAKKYQDKIDFAILFWDTKQKAKELAKNFNTHIKVFYINETTNKHAYIIKNLKHSLGLPTCYLISNNKKLMNIKRSVFHPYNLSKEASFKLNYEAINSAISNNLLGKSGQEAPGNFREISPQ